MKVRLGDVVDSQPAIEQVMALKLSPKVGYRIGKACRRIQRETEEWQRIRQPLLEEYGVQDAARPGWFSVAPENLERFNAAMRELNDVEVELEGVEPIPVEALGDIVVPVAAMTLLDWLFTEDGLAQKPDRADDKTVADRAS